MPLEIRQPGIVDRFHGGMLVEPRCHLLAVAAHAVDLAAQRAQVVEDHQRTEGTETRTVVAQRQQLDVEGKVGTQLVRSHAAGNRVAGDDRAGDGHAAAAHGLAQRLHHDVGTVLDGPHEGGRGDRAVNDERQVVAVRDLGQAGNVEETQAGVAGHFAKEQARTGVDLARPFVQIQRVAHPAHLDAALGLVALAEEHEGAAVALGAGDDVHVRRGVPVAATRLLHQERVCRHKDRCHARRRDRGAHFAWIAVAFEQRQRLLEVALCRVGDARISPRRHLVGERRFHVVAVLEVLAGGKVARLDDAALVGQRRLHVVEAVHGDRVELLAAHDRPLARGSLHHLRAARHVRLHAGGKSSCLHSSLLTMNF